MTDSRPTAGLTVSSVRKRSAVVAGLMYLSIALVCTQIPLLNYLGYEFSAVVAAVGSLIAGMMTISAVRNWQGDDWGGSAAPVHLVRSFSGILFLNQLLLVVPLAVISANAFFVKNCAYLEGLAYFVLLPVVSVWFSSCVGLFCAVHYRWSRVIFFAVVFMTLSYALLLGYCTPAIFSYNFFYGYFPGFSYDEILKIDIPLILFRILTLLLGGMVLWLSVLIVTEAEKGEPAWKKGLRLLEMLVRPRHLPVTLAILLGLALVYVHRCELGFESTAPYVRRILGEEYRSEHFVIYYSGASYDEGEIRRVAALHEFRLSQILSAFMVHEHVPIESYLYPSAEVKRRLIGTGTTNIAKPWLRQVHLTNQSLEATLKHELVHVVAGQFGLPIINASLSTGLVEGLAMAVDWDFGNRTLHQYAAGMKTLGLAPDISTIMTPAGFAAHPSAVSYVLAGSFCRYLIDTYGIGPMARLYRSGDYTEAYGRSLPLLMGEWNTFLGRIPAPGRDAVEVLFRQPAIFRKVCARVIARRNEEARNLFAEHKYAGARWLYGLSFGEAGGYEALSGLIISALRQADFPAVVGVLDSIERRSEHPGQFAPLQLSYGDAVWAQGNINRARDSYERIRREDIAENLTEAAAARLIALSDTAARAGFLRYFLSDAPDSVRITFLDSVSSLSPHNLLVPYLRGRLSARLGRYQDAADVLSGLSMTGLSPELEGMRLKTVGASLLRLARFDEARKVLSRAFDEAATEVARLEITDMIARNEWMASHGT